MGSLFLTERVHGTTVFLNGFVSEDGLPPGTLPAKPLLLAVMPLLLLLVHPRHQCFIGFVIPQGLHADAPLRSWGFW